MQTGINIIEGWITEEEEQKLLEQVSAGKAKQKRHGRSSIRRYGTQPYKNDFVSDTIPDSFQFLVGRLKDIGIETDHVTVNHYEAGRSLAAHIDNKASGDVIVVLSLLSPAEMALTLKKEREVITLNPRSLLLMSGEARWKWKHEILPIKAEVGRWSIVFRKYTP